MGLVKRDYESKPLGSHHAGEDTEDAETNALLNEWIGDGTEGEEGPCMSVSSQIENTLANTRLARSLSL